MKKVTKLGVALASCSVVFAACGSGSLSAEEQVIADKFAEEISDDSEFSDFASEEDAACIGKGMVKTIGLERLEELGVTEDEIADNPDFTEDEEKKLVSATFDCLDTQKILEGTGLPEEMAKCIADDLGEKEIRSMMEAAALDEQDEDMEEKMEKTTEKCVEE